jgi:hypothetical protein
MRRPFLSITSNYDSALLRSDGGGGRLARGRLFGSAGRGESLAFAARTGTQAGAPVTLAGLPEATAVADVLRGDWNTAGRTLTVRVFRSGVLVTEGTTTSGPTTHKGAAVPSPAVPAIAAGLPPGSYEVEVETDGVMRYAATLEG